MKVQYFGDINDYRNPSRQVQVWRLLDADGGRRVRPRGQGWLPQATAGAWRAYDPQLFDALAKMQAPPQRSDLQRIEAEGIVPGATFFDEDTPDKLAERQAFHARCMATFADRDLVFFDPDNGLEIRALPMGLKRSSK